MTAISSRMQSAVGCIISLNINGRLFIKNLLKRNSLKNPSQSQEQPEEESQAATYKLSQSPLQEYVVTLSNEDDADIAFDTIYILARDSMEAAYNALELSTDRHCKLLDVRLCDEW